MIAILLYAQALAIGFILPSTGAQEAPQCILQVRNTGPFRPVPASIALLKRERVASDDVESWIRSFQEKHGMASAILDSTCAEVAAVLVYATDASSIDPVRVAAYSEPHLACNMPVDLKRRRVAEHLAAQPPVGTAKYVVLARGTTGAYRYVIHYNWDASIQRWQSQLGTVGCDISVGDSAPIPQ